MLMFRNKHFTKRDYESTNVVACLAESAPDENWIPTTHEELNTMLNSPIQPLLRDALDALKQQLAAECLRVGEIRQEKAKLAPAYQRYVALQKELNERSKVIDELAGMLGPDGAYKAMQEDKTDAIGETMEIHTSMAQLRSEVPLWRAMRWYLEYAGEAKINDVLIFLGDLAKKWESRNAVESALRLHPEIFQVRKVKRDKYISLKGV